MTTRKFLIALVGATVVVGTDACGNSIPSKPGPASETITTAASSACSDLAGTVGTDQVCTVHSGAPGYTIDMKFPTDYPDQRALSDLLTRERDQFVKEITAPPQSRMSYRCHSGA